MLAARATLGLLVLAALTACGCKTVSQSKYAALQSQNRTLTEQTHSQLSEIENLKIHSRHVEDQLIQAEEDLARAEGPGRSGRALSGLAVRSQDRHQQARYRFAF